MTPTDWAGAVICIVIMITAGLGSVVRIIEYRQESRRDDLGVPR